MTELKPCPFCGREAKKMIGPEEWIECSVCHACTAMHSDIKYAILDWNRRVSE